MSKIHRHLEVSAVGSHLEDEKASAEGSESNAVQAMSIDPKAQRALVRKLDLALLPLFTLICESLSSREWPNVLYACVFLYKI